jgi:hypothetical protein
VATAKHLPRLRKLVHEPTKEATSPARKLLSRSFAPAPVDADAAKAPLPAASHHSVQFISAAELLAYTQTPHKPMLLLPWFPSCTTCNATAWIADEANKMLGEHALNVRAIRWEDDGLWRHWLGNTSLIYMLNSSLVLPPPPITFVMNGITWYSKGPGTTPSTEPPPADEYPQLLATAPPDACLHDADLEADASDATQLHDRRCLFDMAALLSRSVHLRLPVLCQTMACALLQRCTVLPNSDSIVSDCTADEEHTRASSERLRDKLSLHGSYAFPLDDFLGGNYARVKVLFDDGGSGAASDVFRLFALLLQDEATLLDFAVMGDPELVARFEAPPSSLVVASFPYMDPPRVITRAEWTLQQLYSVFE